MGAPKGVVHRAPSVYKVHTVPYGYRGFTVREREQGGTGGR